MHPLSQAHDRWIDQCWWTVIAQPDTVERRRLLAEIGRVRRWQRRRVR